MADNYLDDRLREAFKLGKGSPGLAQRLLIEWAVKDQRLLLALVRPFMRAVVTAAVEGAIRRGVVAVAAPVRRPARPAPTLTGSQLDDVLAMIGRGAPDAPRPDGAVGSAGPVVGTPVPARADKEAPGVARPAGSEILNPPERPAAGAGHVDAIKAIAAAFKQKRRP